MHLCGTPSSSSLLLSRLILSRRKESKEYKKGTSHEKKMTNAVKNVRTLFNRTILETSINKKYATYTPVLQICVWLRIKEHVVPPQLGFHVIRIVLVCQDIPHPLQDSKSSKTTRSQHDSNECYTKKFFNGLYEHGVPPQLD